MSAPSVIERVKTTLVALKMPRALEVLDVTLRGIERGEIGAVEAIDALLTEELTTRENRRVRMAVQMARLSAIKTLAGFDFAFQPSLDRNRILALAGLQFVDRAEALHLIGPPGTGKTHLSLALGVEAVKAGRSVYFSSLADIVATLAKAERDGATSMPLGSVGYEHERQIWLEPRFVDRLRAMRGPGESYSDVILRLAKGERTPSCHADAAVLRDARYPAKPRAPSERPSPRSETVGTFASTPPRPICEMTRFCSCLRIRRSPTEPNLHSVRASSGSSPTTPSQLIVTTFSGATTFASCIDRGQGGHPFGDIVDTFPISGSGGSGCHFARCP
jgi:hypothetical protein